MSNELTTLGRELIKAKLPDKYKKYADVPLDKKQTSKLMTAIALEDPEAYIDILQDMNNISQVVLSTYGRDAALSFDDAKIGSAAAALNKRMHEVVDSVLNNDKLTDKQKEQKIIELGYKYTTKIQDEVFKDHDTRHTALAGQINSGSRGNKTQLMQMSFGSMLMKDALGRDIPYLMMEPYVKGTTPTAYWASSSSGRKGNVDVQMATGQAGYMGKQVTAATHKTVIETDDCGTTDTGVPFPANSDKNIGAVLLKPFKGHPAGSIVTADMVAEADDDDEMILRSPTTCLCRNGVCAKCNGLAENGKFPGIGDFVALNAARSFIEPLTQGAISSKHGSGLGGKKVIDPEGEDQPTGFKNVERMFRAQSVFPGGAVLTPIDGFITNITKAPQGGTYVTVGDQQLYCNANRTVTVKKGDKVFAGDTITNGVPSPREVCSLKGVGEGRHYFTNKLNEILQASGAGTDRRNVEAISRAFISKVRITNPDGIGTYLPGEIVDYNELVANYTPPDDTKEWDLSQATNKYLEKPVLYYTIGTRITPKVSQELKKYNFTKVTASDTAPGFEAQFVKPAEILQHDSNWLPRLAGERLYDSLFDAARKGITDSYDSPSYVDKIVAAPYKP